jgi:UDP-N-acetyl-alpha-D-muramoyl-L-alanyl-L-glutamate epimerase
VTVDARRALRFEYVGFDVEPEQDRVVCRYRLVGLPGPVPDREFQEVVSFPGGGDWSRPAVREAARILFLLTGVSYYKAGAPPVVDLGATALTASELAFLTEYYQEGLGEFAYRNDLDLTDLTFVGPVGGSLERSGPVGYEPEPGRPLVPFGGGVDSIVSVELIRERADDVALFVVNRPGDRFDAIEEPARVTGLPVVRADRSIDDAVLRSRELGFLNGHVPVTGIISAIAVLAAVLEGRDAVVLSNEWSASSATLEVDGRAINHQYSKSERFEAGLRRVIAESIGPAPDYFSLLRPLTEVWIAARFAGSPQYLDHFRSCNRAFRIDRATRYDHWCGVCDKCCFIDLVLAPFVDESALRRVFARAGEPLANPELKETFRRLLALTPDAKPWECVGDVAESRVAARLAAARPDRKENEMLAALVDEAEAFADPEAEALMRPIGRHFVPERYAPDVLV